MTGRAAGWRPSRSLAARLCAVVASFGLCLAGANAQQQAPGEAREPASVTNFQPKRYLGRWHEIARLPNRFQKECAAYVTADYAALEDGDIRVTNRCQKADGSTIVAEGRARQPDSRLAQLRVSFLPDWLRWLPFTEADYWVLALSPDYRYALVGTPGRDYLWVLSRTPTLPAEVTQALLLEAAAMGYPADQVQMTKQTP
ncbi:lipocalin family protein [Uliginosibacterium sp. H1]|uniref:lipocalin family protein n=1 Tax=Uliginosibacterium sp. H1 TaxID=3114757 RepID=UPI002E19AA54|nr:lipocalin family protein [Uliginosibacterium sp. H1]